MVNALKYLVLVLDTVNGFLVKSNLQEDFLRFSLTGWTHTGFALLSDKDSLLVGVLHDTLEGVAVCIFTNTSGSELFANWGNCHLDLLLRLNYENPV